MTVTINGTTGVTTPDVTSDSYTGPISVNASAPDNSVVLDASGNLGVGTTSPAARIHASRANDGDISRFSGPIGRIGYQEFSGVAYLWNSSTDLLFGTDTNNNLRFGTNNTERARIDSSGNLLVGTTSISGTTGFVTNSVSTGYGSIAVCHSTAATGGTAFQNFYYNSGVIGSITQNGTTAVAYNTSSDYRLKEDIQPMTSALAKVAALKPCTYKWKADGSDGEGFIAHELQAVVPQCVTGEKDAVDAEGNPVYQGIDTSFLVATLTAAIQELKAIVDQQAIEIANLKGQA